MTKIEWCDETLNPFAGCTKVSEGCEHCCALSFARRLQGQGRRKYAGVTKDGKWTGRVNFDFRVLEKSKHWRKPRRIFLQIMGDIAHGSVRFDDFRDVMLVVFANPQHRYIMLTKRPHRLGELLQLWYNSRLGMTGKTMWELHMDGPMPQLQIGVTAENQEQADKRIPILLQIPAAVRFVSIEPMLAPVVLWGAKERFVSPTHTSELCVNYLTLSKNGRGLDWVICGAETGPGKRKMELDWARQIQDQCFDAGIPFFFKRGSDGNHELDGRVWEEYPR